MVGHEGESALPVCDAEVGVAEPGVAVCVAAAPFSFGDMVVEVDVDFLDVRFCCDGIEDLLDMVVRTIVRRIFSRLGYSPLDE